MLGLNSKS